MGLAALEASAALAALAALAAPTALVGIAALAALAAPSRAAAWLLVLAVAPVLAQGTDWPEWVLNPAAPSGEQAGELVGTDCVEASGNLSLDRQQVTAKARLVLAQQIEVRIDAMDETFASRASAGRVERLAVSFKSSSRQVVGTTLQGSRLVRFEVFTQRDGARFVCGMVALERRRSEQLPGDVIRTAGAKMDDETETLLLARFRQAAAARSQAPGAPLGGKP